MGSWSSPPPPHPQIALWVYLLFLPMLICMGARAKAAEGKSNHQQISVSPCLPWIPLPTTIKTKCCWILTKRPWFVCFVTIPPQFLKVFEEAIATNTNSYHQSQVNTVYSSNSKYSPKIQNSHQTHLPQIPRYLLILIPHQNLAQTPKRTTPCNCL